MAKNIKTEIYLKADLKKYSIETIRYAAYVFTGMAYVSLKKIAGTGLIEAVFKLKPGFSPGEIKSLKKRFEQELKWEKLRSAILEHNQKLREFLIKKAMSSGEMSRAPERLTPEQEKELEKLIAQVESEIKKESKNSRKKSGDPLEISKTWEEKYGGKSAGIK
ncbi:MAG: hypothetical protein HY746_01855 [Elusimicrobia bacterium]|nr:hypothetical protein [Elusimicrobiota bacterium]